MTSLKGKLLVASPKLLDTNFVRTVILMVDHSDSGALGLVLNRPTGLTIKDLWAQVAATTNEELQSCLVDGNVYQGGPCTGTLMVLHTQDTQSQIQVLSGLHFSSQLDQITTLLGTAAAPMKVYYGYSGWGNGQLEREMETGSWLVADTDVDTVFSTRDSLWDSLVKTHFESLGIRHINPRFIPPDPSMN